MSFKVAIIGRPNVGKSTLFNRLTGSRDALVNDQPGLTRDRREGLADIGGLKFTVIDTAGLEKAETGSLEELMMAQTKKAIEDADIVLMTIDGREGVTALDHHFAKMIRKMGKPTLMLVNKCENERRSPGIVESFKLGFGDPIPVSAEHSVGFADLIERLMEMAEKLGLNTEEEVETERTDLQVCILGRPNVGKSTLFNAIVGEDRSIISDFAGTTRDSIYYDIEFNGNKIKLVDTAGVRKRMKRAENLLEELSVEDSMKALQYANVAIMVFDATLGIDKMDLHLTGQVLDEGRALVIVINKWDAVDDIQKREIKDLLEEKLEFSISQARNCPVVFASALKGDNVEKILNYCLEVYDIWNRRVSTGKLNKWLKTAVEENIPPLSGGKRVKLKYATQVKSRPPTFCIFTSSNTKDLPESYMRYLKNSMDREFDFKGVPVRIFMRKTNNPFEGLDRDRNEDDYK